MPTGFQHAHVSNPFIARTIGLALASDLACDHGQAAVSLVLFGRYLRAAAGNEQRIDVALPRCTAADFIGSLMATVRLQEGDAAAQALTDDIAASTAKATAMLQDLHDQRRDCCQAGFRTQGSEHTCSAEADRE